MTSPRAAQLAPISVPLPNISSSSSSTTTAPDPSSSLSSAPTNSTSSSISASAFGFSAMQATTDAILLQQQQQMNAAAAASRFSQPNTPSPSATTSSPVGTSLQRSSSTSSHSYLTAPRPPLSASSNAASNSINGGRSTSLLSRPTTSHSAASSDTGGSISSSTHAPAPCLPTQPAAAAGTNSSDLLRRVSNGDGSTSSTSASASASTSSLAATRVPGQTKHRWSSDETQALVDGCNKHGVGSWKIILDDASFAGRFVNRTAGDLKDRFRTYFPDAYHELYPNAKTHHGRKVRSKDAEGNSIFEKGKGKQKRPFSHEETQALHDGYVLHGAHWAKIGKDPVFQGQRTATDLRDRFRNAFREEYEQAGYKARPRSTRRTSSSHQQQSSSASSAVLSAGGGASSNASSVSGGEWSGISDAASDGNLTDHSSSFSHSNAANVSAADDQRVSQVGPQRRKTSVRSARKSESSAAGAMSDASSSRASSLSLPRPQLVQHPSDSSGGGLPQQQQFLTPALAQQATAASGGYAPHSLSHQQQHLQHLEQLQQQHQQQQHMMHHALLAQQQPHGLPPSMMMFRDSHSDVAEQDITPAPAAAAAAALRRSQSSRRTPQKISDREFGRGFMQQPGVPTGFPNMMATDSEPSDGLFGDAAQQQQSPATGGGGFPWLSAMQMQIAMQLQEFADGDDGNEEDDEGDSDEESDDGGADFVSDGLVDPALRDAVGLGGGIGSGRNGSGAIDMVLLGNNGNTDRSGTGHGAGGGATTQFASTRTMAPPSSSSGANGAADTDGVGGPLADQDALFSAPTVMQKGAADDIDMTFSDHLDASMAQFLAPGFNLQSLNEQDMAAFQEQFAHVMAQQHAQQQNGDSDDDELHDQDAEAEMDDDDQQQPSQPQSHDWKEIVERLQNGGVLNDEEARAFGFSPIPSAPSTGTDTNGRKKSSETLREEPGALAAYLNTAAAGFNEEQGFDPSALEEWLGQQAGQDAAPAPGPSASPSPSATAGAAAASSAAAGATLEGWDPRVTFHRAEASGGSASSGPTAPSSNHG